MSVKRVLPHVLIVLALLVAQHGGYEHALSHFDKKPPTNQNKQLPHTKVCDRCGLSAQLGAGLFSDLALFVVEARCACGTLLLSQAFHPTAPRRFLSRAPPPSL